MVPKSTLLLKNSDLSQPTGLSNGYWSDLNGDGKTQALFPQTCSVEARHFPESGEHLSMHLPGWCCLVAKLRLTLCNPRDCNPEAPLPVGLPRQELLEWVAISSFRDLPDPRIKPASPAWQIHSLSLSHLGNPCASLPSAYSTCEFLNFFYPFSH